MTADIAAYLMRFPPALPALRHLALLGGRFVSDSLVAALLPGGCGGESLGGRGCGWPAGQVSTRQAGVGAGRVVQVAAPGLPGLLYYHVYPPVANGDYRRVSLPQEALVLPRCCIVF